MLLIFIDGKDERFAGHQTFGDHVRRVNLKRVQIAEGAAGKDEREDVRFGVDVDKGKADRTFRQKIDVSCAAAVTGDLIFVETEFPSE